MKIKSAIVIFLLGFSFLSAEKQLKQVFPAAGLKVETGLFLMGSGCFAADGNVYVADVKGHFVAAFSPAGRMLHKTGQMGQGPGDFFHPRVMGFFNEKLLVYDSRNRRIVNLDKNLKWLKAFPVPRGLFFTRVQALNEKQFLGKEMLLKPDQGRLKVFDSQARIVRHFFQQTPMGPCPNNLDRRRAAMLSHAADVKTAVLKENKTIALAFANCRNPLGVQILDFSGNIKQTFTYKYAGEYQFPGHLLAYPPKKPPASFCQGFIDSVVTGNNEVYVHLMLSQTTEKKSVTRQSRLLRFDLRGRLTADIELPEHRTLRFFAVSDQGLLLARDFAAETESFFLFSIEDNAK